MGPIHDNFISWWQLHMLTVGQPDKMLIDLRNSKGSTELSAVWMENLIRGVNQEYVELCVFTLHVGVLRQSTRYSNVTSSFLPQPSPLAEATITHRLVIPLPNAVFRGSIPAQFMFLYHLWLCSVKLQQCNFLAGWPLQLIQASSLSSTSRTTAL